jgi:hypothetical protein
MYPREQEGVTVNPDPTSWVAVEQGREFRENLWLNLSDGHIGSGRSCVCGAGADWYRQVLVPTSRTLGGDEVVQRRSAVPCPFLSVAGCQTRVCC